MGGHVDRRAALKERHRRAILDAARDLAAEQQGARFGVDELAQRADVARRTVFNHFGSSDGVRVALAEEAIERAIGDVMASSRAVTASGAGSAVDDLVRLIRGADLPAAVRTVSDLLSVLEPARATALTGEAMSHVADTIAGRLGELHPEADRLRIRLLVAALISGVSTISADWLGRHGGRLDPAARADWDGLLALVVDLVRSGHRDL